MTEEQKAKGKRNLDKIRSMLAAGNNFKADFKPKETTLNETTSETSPDI